MRAIPENEGYQTLLSNVKVQAPGIQGVQRKGKGKKK